LVKLFISEIVHTEDSFLLKLYYKFNFATEPFNFTNNIWFMAFLFIVMILHILKVIFAPKKNRSDEYRN
ncbi:hypothetical protein D0409_09785, partial [Staphylococcus epidermidis]|nr:hypothetical protein [Staphylococcus epidermidis]